MSNQQMNPQALAELTRRVERAGRELDEASTNRRAAINSRAGAAIAIAERARSGMAITPESITRYEESVISLGEAQQTAREKHQRYEQLAEQLYQEMEKPPAVAPAEGDETKTNQ